MIRIYRTTDRSKPVFQSTLHDPTPYYNGLTKMKAYLKLRHPMLVLEDVARKADDKHLGGSDYQESARQLLTLVLKASGYDLEEIVFPGHPEMEDVWTYACESEVEHVERVNKEYRNGRR